MEPTTFRKPLNTVSISVSFLRPPNGFDQPHLRYQSRPLLTSQPTPAQSSAQPLPVAFPADSVPQVARGMPSKVCLGNLSFQVGVIKATLRSDERGSVQAALNNIVPGQTPELAENRTFSYQAYSDSQKNSGQMSVSGEVDNQNNLLLLTAMHVHPDMLPATTEMPVFESVRLAPPLLLKFRDVRMVNFDHTEDNVGVLSFRELDSTRSSKPLQKLFNIYCPVSIKSVKNSQMIFI